MRTARHLQPARALSQQQPTTDNAINHWLQRRHADVALGAVVVVRVLAAAERAAEPQRLEAGRAQAFWILGVRAAIQHTVLDTREVRFRAMRLQRDERALADRCHATDRESVNERESECARTADQALGVVGASLHFQPHRAELVAL